MLLQVLVGEFRIKTPTWPTWAFFTQNKEEKKKKIFIIIVIIKFIFKF